MAEKKKKRGVRALLYGMVCLCLAGIGYSAYQLITIQNAYSEGDNLYAEIRAQVAPAHHTPNARPSQTPAVEAESGQLGNASPAPASRIDFAPLYQINRDTVAWITIEGTVIDYPVVQAADNDYYLDHLFSGKRGMAGSIFMERANAPDFSDKNTLIFGHHMNNGSMFAGLDRYRNQAYYEEHPAMTLYTPQGDYTVEWFAGYAIKAAPLPIAFSGDDAFMQYVEKAREKSNFSSDTPVLPTDRIVTLCTCSYVSDDARYILVGVIR